MVGLGMEAQHDARGGGGGVRPAAQTRGRPATDPPAARIDALDGLRAVSILIVLIGHGAHTAGAPAIMHGLGEMGIVGVELFFTISGFIITHLLLRERERSGSVDLRRFWLRRALRIVPPFAAATIGIAIAAGLGVIVWSWTSFAGAVTLTHNLPLFKGDWFFGHIWSLSLEEQFYLVWPLVLTLAAGAQRASGVLIVIIAGSVVVTPLTVLYVKPLQTVLPYLPDLAGGCLLALALHQPVLPGWLQRYRALPARGAIIAVLAASAMVVAWLRGRDLQDMSWVPLYALLLPVTGLLLVAEIVLPDGRLRRALAVSPLCWLGRISYSLYLWQQLFMGPADAYPDPWLWSRWPFNLLAAIACGALAYELVEKPGVRLKQLLDRRDASTSARAHSHSPAHSRADTKGQSQTATPLR